MWNQDDYSALLEEPAVDVSLPVPLVELPSLVPPLPFAVLDVPLSLEAELLVEEVPAVLPVEELLEEPSLQPANSPIVRTSANKTPNIFVF
ncbi:hypothetical protein [Candidatus Soleaferrea massiliensis]|uniref:hypothetical protein n=1 Tax=Candidatus Soleaferrea massiliensis TaxID=1470354 RepID=UPI00058E1E3D|nr:hypothetical protein [Candidatus Soleaferrea massiliensis]